ncbi:MAG TPA: HK97-gp10 family putative phage morphogenesis protein [Sphingomonadales bacterium]|nr:HK97-gp10 family putative phage morphogenesis protein [Sphingomonadales bacterium]
MKISTDANLTIRLAEAQEKMILLKFKNLPSLRRGLAAYAGKVRDGARAGVEAGAEAIAAGARARVPVETGRLRESIGITAANASLNGAISAAVNAAAPYARFVEFGTLQSPARPFLHPAALEHFPDILRDIRSALNKALPE